MAYLILSDYWKSIQDVNLQQVITSTESIRKGAELGAQAEAISYLRQKYETGVEFTDTTKWDKTAPYSAKDRVYLDATTYAPATAYVIGDFALYLGNVYECNNATTGAFNAADWDLKGAQYELFNALLPFKEFNYEKLYNVGDRVFWKGNVYSCLVQTVYITHETKLQYRVENNVPYSNVWPDDLNVGDKYWFNEGAYIVDAGTDITNGAFWVSTDNRDQQMVLYFVDITLYHLHARIAPRNIPQLRIDRYNSAIDWLKMCARGEITPNLPLIQPKTGNRIRWGGQIRNINTY